MLPETSKTSPQYARMQELMKRRAALKKALEELQSGGKDSRESGGVKKKERPRG